MVILSVTGLFRTLLIIIGVFVVLRFFGQLMVAKRNAEEHEKVARERREAAELMAQSRSNFGKTTISKLGKSDQDKADFADFEEVN